MAARRTVRALWVLLVVVLVLAVVKAFVADVYRIDSDSMRPTIFGGEDGEPLTEWVLVLYDRDLAPGRFDLAVVDLHDGTQPIVKRVVGLPGERIRIVGGDLLVNGKRLAADAPRPAPIPVFDDAFCDVGEEFQLAEAPGGPWTRDGAEWELDARGLAPGGNRGLMLYVPDLSDDYLMPDGKRIEGMRQVNDGILECQFRIEEPGTGALRFLLIEEGDTFEARIGRPDDEGHTPVQVIRRGTGTAFDADPGEEPLAQGSAVLSVGRWYDLRFSNVDDHLALEIPEAGFQLRESYDENVPDKRRSLQGDGAHGDRSFGNRVGLGGEGCRARFRRIRILRDLFYTDVDQHGTRSEQSLGPDEYFLLGDNSAQSKDSRAFGPVEGSDLVGEPVAVVWPPGRIRWLR